MKPIEDLSTQPGVLAVTYPRATYRPLVEICDAELRTTIETLLPRRHAPGSRTRGEYDAALAGLGYVRTSTWRVRGGLAYCEVTTAQPNPTD